MLQVGLALCNINPYNEQIELNIVGVRKLAVEPPIVDILYACSTL